MCIKWIFLFITVVALLVSGCASTRFTELYKTIERNESLPVVKNFVPFSHVNGFVPGKTRYSELVKTLGQPEAIEITEKWEIAGVKGGGNTLIKYPSQGLSFHVWQKEASTSTDPTIGLIVMIDPYKGISPNGLYIGMPRDTAFVICYRDYRVNSKFHSIREYQALNFYEFLSKEGEKGCFRIYFKDQKLSTMQLYE